MRHPSGVEVREEAGEPLRELREKTTWSAWVEEGGSGVVLCNFTETWRRNRDAMERERISLSGHLRGRYRIYFHVWWIQYMENVRPHSVRRDSWHPDALIIALPNKYCHVPSTTCLKI